MEILIKAEAKEIADLVLQLQSQQFQKNSFKPESSLGKNVKNDTN